MQLTDINTLLSKSLDEESLTDKQKSVLQASIKLFAEKGYAETKTADIAKKAGVAEGTVYKHFKTKENILNAILIPFIQGVVPKVASEFSAEVNQVHFDSLKDFLNYIIRDRLNFAVKNQFIAKVFLQEIIQKKKLAVELLTIVKSRLSKSITPVLENLKSKNELVDISTEKFLQYLFSILMGYMVPFIIKNDYQNLNINKITEDATNFLMNGMHP
ncbi:TetR/AcrR family transcriptional regulator [Apilactobacillus apisilvae]|uniref:TetR/AcrR family transcriptional regulator n=1 Tax=Apilactobacillus apisilvae TaxID=2923364 RepID=A0ABY4PHA7_9LACO|nr:TetR/AcrR family transcriptional regulator [Apilactobacillus apisilvae]UQS84849.1 TetR/AcrR family transcriptional regulator [Apilactobacillus apisilvae]